LTISLSVDIVTKKKLNILIQLAQADKHFAKEERDMIYRIAKQRNFPEEMVAELIRNPEPIDSFGALSEEQKLDYLISAIELILADERVFESEIIFCKNIAIKLGFHKNVVEFMIEHLNKTPLPDLKKKVLTDFMMP
jgi:uncharacterized tellurite resistance protein B-like protein